MKLDRIFRLLRFGALALLALLILATAAWKIHKSRTFQLMGTLVPRVETTDSLVALTFDDGPTPRFTQQILSILGEKDVPATFFLVGSALERFPEEARLLAEAGHELGNHSYTHRHMVLRRLSTVEEEVERTDRALRALGYTGPIHFRAPYGKRLVVLPYYLKRTGRVHVLWDVEPESYREVARDSARIVEHVVERVRPGSIVLLHPFFESRRESVKAVPAIIEELERRGYRFVTVSELMANSDSTEFMTVD